MTEQLRELVGPIDIYLFDQIQRGRLDRCSSVLDAGCGGGRNLTWFLRSGMEVFGVDRDPRSIEAVRALAARLAPGLPRANFQAGEIETLPWPDLQVDAVICSAVLHFARDEHHFEAMLESIWAALRPGGLFFARLASSIGLEVPIDIDRNRRAHLPDGSTRFLVDEAYLLEWTQGMDATLLDPIKTTNVQNQRCMTTWILRKN